MRPLTPLVPARTLRRLLLAGAGAAALAVHSLAAATTPLADQPLFTNVAVPGNLALALSVEFPTAISVAHQGNFDASRTYLGYFDPNKCYRYQQGTEVGDDVSHFFPVGAAASRRCNTAGLTDAWSGNFMNWLTMQAIDPFRWALTGGYRRVDTTTTTILERAWASNQGNNANFPVIPTTDADPLRNRSSPSATDIADHTPLSWADIRVGVRTYGNRVRFTRTGTLSSTPTHYSQGLAVAEGTVYDFFVRVKVCDTASGAGGVESNCKSYPGGISKPEGLLQKYSDRIRYSAFGYLNDSSLTRDGGVLRARQKFVGPEEPVPGGTPTTNARREWSATTGILELNPDATDATDTATLFGVPVSNSGVLNYLNKFGQVVPGTYKTFDPISELYYAAIRYFKKLGNVSSWSAPGSASVATKTTWVDGFPVVTNWDDPILYSCQRNFILGIGDFNTHADKNVPGNSLTANEPAMPAQVSADTTVNAVTATNKVGALEGLGSSLGTTNPYGGCCNNNSALIAGLAYDSNTKDIRPDDASKPNTKGKQTIQTYWLDVVEYANYKKNNQYYLAAKYGGFKVPESFEPYTHSTALPTDWWHTSGEKVGSGTTEQLRPDNYYVASRPDQMVDGLTKAFASIAAALKAYTTSFSTSLPQLSITGNASFAAQYDSENWTGEVVASELSFDPVTMAPSQAQKWKLSDKLNAQLSGTGWDSKRRVVTWDPSTGKAVPFRHASLSAAQKLALDTAYRTGDDSADYVNYLRGDKTHEVTSTVSGSAKAYRPRLGPLGDVVGSRVRPVGPPAYPLSDSTNPGYSVFKSTWAGRPLVVYFGANDGMLHAVNGELSGSGAGEEIFAYVPSGTITGPSGTPGSDGLAALGNPTFTHKYFVDSTPTAWDVDLGKTPGGSGTDWRTLLIGGMGKGGRSYYAIDVTDPKTITDETKAAARVMWEFTDPDMGYSYGEPVVVKTKQHGWVVILTSGYNNADGKGYIFIVNPRNGALIQKLSTGAGSTTGQAGLAHANAYIVDRTDGTADAIYAGDLLGNVWRVDITAASGSYSSPVKLAELRDSGGKAQPVTTRVLIEIQPISNRRFVLVGTGQLLDNPDIFSKDPQTFYAIKDGNAVRFTPEDGLPTGVKFPLKRADLLNNTNLLTGINYNDPSQMGWYHDLGTADSGVAWRFVINAATFYGAVLFSPMLPSGDACNPSGISRFYAVDLGTGKTLIRDPSNPESLLPYSTPVTGVGTDVTVDSVAGTPVAIVGSSKGEVAKPDVDLGNAAGFRRLNWRELPTAD